ncbi:MAG TPA: hypothetical protein VMJ52_01370 [Xanthobacteraceae bacterium]|nr:hypothetical protein [Xanthobacteraceae bacterium]
MVEPIKNTARIFAIDTRFQKMAKRPGGVPRDVAVKRAEKFIDELKPEFVIWLDTELQELSAAVRGAEGSSFDPSWHKRAYRTSSRLRDVGGTMGYEMISFIAGNFCEVLDVIDRGIAYDRDVMNCHLDSLFLVKTEPYRNLTPEQLPEMTNGLRRVVEFANSAADRTVK